MSSAKISREQAAAIQAEIDAAKASIKRAQELARLLEADGLVLRKELSGAVVKIREAEMELRSLENPIMVSEAVQRAAEAMLRRSPLDKLQPLNKAQHKRRRTAQQ